MFTKDEFKLKIFVAVCWIYSKLCISIVQSSVPLVNHSVVKIWILALPISRFLWLKKLNYTVFGSLYLK